MRASGVIAGVLCLMVASALAQTPSAENNELCVQVLEDDGNTYWYELTPIGTSLCRDQNCDHSVVTGNSYVQQLWDDEHMICQKIGFQYKLCGVSTDPILEGCSEDSEGLNGIFEIRSGLYEIKVHYNYWGNVTNALYYDNRHCDFIEDEGCDAACPGGNDITLRYRVSDHSLWFANETTDLDPSLAGYQKLMPYEAMNWWESADCPNQCHSEFAIRPFSLLNLTVNSNDNPVLNWSHPFGWTGMVQHGRELSSYEVQRAVLNSTMSGNSFQTVYTETDTNTHVFIDIAIEVTPAPTAIQYRIKTNYTDGSSEYSNACKITGQKSGQGSLLADFDDDVPGNFGLEQNYPNPFNPSTSIRYWLKEAADVEITVYDIQGREVATLVAGSQEAGEHVVQWVSVDAQGVQVASGQYLVKMAVGSTVKTTMVVLSR